MRIKKISSANTHHRKFKQSYYNIMLECVRNVDKVQVHRIPDAIKKLTNFDRLQQTLKAAWGISKTCPTSPLFKFYGVEDLSIESEPHKGEAAMINDLFKIMNQIIPFK